ncbi:MAG: hypothetical protein J1E65_01415 [Lachnospiraceae bacterium]|nr:hypothetical protein [Lachnospiraceae bacterium]
MEKIYIALVDTPGLFANIIRLTIHREYIHVVLGLDETLSEAYSFGRRNPQIPFFSGFEKENLERIIDAFPTARYRIYSLDCTKEQKIMMQEKLHHLYKHRFRYHYCVWGLPYILLQKPFYQKRHYTCSSFLARFLEENGIRLFEKHFSLITPADFYDYKKHDIIFEGPLKEFLRKGTEEEDCGTVKGVLYEG